MSRYKSWRPRFADVVEVNHLQEDAEEARYEAYRALTEDVGFDATIADSLLPEMPRVELVNVNSLRESFMTRADFNSYKSYLRRLIKASETKPRRGTLNIAPDYPNNLVSFYLDEDGQLSESAFMRSERRRIDQRMNREAKRRLGAMGIEFERKEVFGENDVPLTDEWGHRITIDVPRTPNMRRMYLEAIQEHQNLAIIQPDDAEGGRIDLWGDMVEVGKVGTHRMSPSAMAKAQLYDEQSYLATLNYFGNYQAIVTDTLPDSIAQEISGYIDRIADMSPAEQAAMYEFVADGPDDAGTIEYLYLDRSTTLPAKVQRIVTFWRDKVAPRLGIDVSKKSVISLEDVPEEVEREFAGGPQAIYDEYQRRKMAGEQHTVTFDMLSRLIGVLNAT